MKSIIRIISILLIVIGITLLSVDKIYYQQKIKIEGKKIESFSKENKTNKISNQFIGIIEIPKIKLRKVLVNPNSVHNNIDENITILKPIMMPDENNSVFILAAHSGNSYNSYFKDLYKLNRNDCVYIYYKNKKYKYKIIKYYEEEKDGSITIMDNTNIKKLILTTCKSYNKQLVYIAYLNKIK